MVNRFEKRIPARKFASTKIDVFEEDVSADATNQLHNNAKYAMEPKADTKV